MCEEKFRVNSRVDSLSRVKMTSRVKMKPKVKIPGVDCS